MGLVHKGNAVQPMMSSRPGINLSSLDQDGRDRQASKSVFRCDVLTRIGAVAARMPSLPAEMGQVFVVFVVVWQ